MRLRTCPPSQITQTSADEFVVAAALQPGTSDATGLGNQNALDAAIAVAGRNNGTVQLPPGTFYFYSEFPNRPLLAFDERSAGITIRGAGRGNTLLVPKGATPSIAIESTLIPYFSIGRFLETGMPTDIVDEIPDTASYAVGDLMCFWTFNESPERSQRQLLTVVDVDVELRTVVVSGVIGVGLPDKPTNFKHIKGARVAGAVAPGTRTIELVEDNDALLFAPGDDIVIGDGPGASQFFGEWATVAAVESDPGTVTLAAGVRRSYADGLTCLVPGRPTAGAGSPRRHLADVTLCDFSIAAPLQSVPGYMGTVRPGVRVRIANVGFGPADPANDPEPPSGIYDVSLAECGSLTMHDCRLDGALRVSVGQDCLFDNLVALSVGLEEYSMDYEFINTTTTGAGGWECKEPPCERINLTDCAIRNYGYFFNDLPVSAVQFANGSRITGLRISDSRLPVASGITHYFKPEYAQLTNVTADRRITFQGGHQQLTNVACAGRMVFDAEHLRVLNAEVTVPSPSVQPVFEFAPSSSGILLSPLPPNADVQFNASVDDWRIVARTRLDGKFQSPADSPVTPLVVLATAGTGVSDYIAEFGTPGGTTLLAVTKDGYLATDLAEDEEPPGKPEARLKLFDLSGNLLGYIPIYNDD